MEDEEGEEGRKEEGGKEGEASLLQCVQVRPSNLRHQVFQPVCVCVCVDISGTTVE